MNITLVDVAVSVAKRIHYYTISVMTSSLMSDYLRPQPAYDRSTCSTMPTRLEIGLVALASLLRVRYYPLPK